MNKNEIRKRSMCKVKVCCKHISMIMYATYWRKNRFKNCLELIAPWKYVKIK